MLVIMRFTAGWCMWVVVVGNTSRFVEELIEDIMMRMRVIKGK